MKFKFNPNIDYQNQAIDSVIQLFDGNRTEESNIAYDRYLEEGKLINVRAVPNKLNLSDDELLDNLKKVQNENEIEQDIEKIENMDFTIEMETGTGKTYVYFRTILELHKKYGMKKFIIVVPSVAIREGVMKTYEITKEHFQKLYDQVIYDCYEYDSSNLNLLKQFANSSNIKIMVMTIDSFNKDENIINRYNDRTEGQKPIELVKATNPILILDEPQNMESEISKEALASLNPLFKLRYSATHRNYYNLIYRLTPVDAYNKNLVKKIEVLSVVEDDDYSNVYVKVKDFDRSSRGIKAKLEIYKKLKSGIKRGNATVYQGDDLLDKSNGLEEYRGFKVSEIDLRYDHIKFENGITLEKSEVQGLDKKNLMKIQIEKTVEEHFRKQYRLRDKDIKVLSLFFIDKVDNYVKEDGFIKKTFKKAYNRLKDSPNEWAKPYKDLESDKVHSGYFAKKDDGDYYDDNSTSYMKQNREAYDLIMKDKEKLLSFEEPTQFIFSHSALREGWDNPNVFNICTLNESYSKIRKRQEIGRGVRIPVDQEGERRFDNENILTVVANESYKDYVAKLQTQYKDDFTDEIEEIDIGDRRKRKSVKFKEDKVCFGDWEEFKELWDRISSKTQYKINLNSDKLKESCIEKINQLDIDDIKVRIDRAEVKFKQGTRLDSEIIGSGSEKLDKKFVIKNFLKKIDQETELTKTTIIAILNGVNNLDLLFKDPYKYVSSIIKIINRTKENLLVNGIKYFQIDDKYEMSLFEDLEGYEDNLVEVDKSIYEYVIFDSESEKRFAEKLDKDPRVNLFVKLPNWFKVNTPIGGYNPDWAIVIDDVDEYGETQRRLYLVRETKHTSGNLENIRESEKKKIICAREHFNEIFKNYDNSNYEAIDLPKEISDLKHVIEF
ncbi:MAG: DEAD/DEAH box helicase family protein [Halanaerobiales bacterium]|nr:DEAD/DEAH box helicase family protein [Halanaerobiales bacterium]